MQRFSIFDFNRKANQMAFYAPGADRGVIERLAYAALAKEQARHEAKYAADADRRALLALKHEMVQLKKFLAERKAGFDPSQPRDANGQWTDGGGDTGYSGSTGPLYFLGEGGVYGEAPDGTAIDGVVDRRRAEIPVDLLDEEGGRGGHSISRHVGKIDDALYQRMRNETFWTARGIEYLQSVGTFTSLQSANSLVNSTLSENWDVVQRVIKGELQGATLEKYFNSITGREAYRETSRSEPYMREANTVRIVILRDASLTRGFRVLTAFPFYRR